MADRMKLNNMRELKLGTTFSNPRNASFHTLKYDFKPASVDESKMATVDIGQNNQVTVTVPHLDGAGTLQTVFKGNQKKYTKECVLIVNKTTGEITIEKLSNNLQVKKTRSENGYKAPPPAASSSFKLENSTQRQSSKTKVTSGIRKTAISTFPKHSPIQGSPTYPVAAQWNASHNQSNLASLPMIGFDDVEPNVNSSPVLPNNNTTMPVSNTTATTDDAVGVISTSSSSSSSSDSSDSDSDSDASDSPAKASNGQLSTPNNILDEDLQLSESD